MKISLIIEKMIQEANYLEVTDIHFAPKDGEVQIFYRMLNKLKYQKSINLEEYNKLLRYVKFKCRLDISKTKEFQDGSFYIENDKKKIFLRISTLPLLNSESLVIRLLNDDIYIKLEDISYIKEDIEVIQQTIKRQVGLFIFTGPTGSGKTTTMYSILNTIIEQSFKKVITIENPVEIINNNFIQVQVEEKLNIDYDNALKAVLRQDPDIIMIGEIRDEKTARNVFRAALTGHTVISTMHTKNVSGVIRRFLDFGFLKSEIEAVLIGISNQRLLLDKNGMIKSVYDYAIGQELQDLIEGKGKNEGIEAKIKKIQHQNNLTKKEITPKEN